MSHLNAVSSICLASLPPQPCTCAPFQKMANLFYKYTQSIYGFSLCVCVLFLKHVHRYRN